MYYKKLKYVLDYINNQSKGNKMNRIWKISIVLFLIMVGSVFAPAYIPVLARDTHHYLFGSALNGGDGHLIENPRVPYVGQPTEFYCTYACLTMLIQYQGFNASLGEVLHHSGIGYSLLYTRYLAPARIPIGGFVICQSSQNTQFLAALYNLSYNFFVPSNRHSNEENWTQYWTQVKKNILNDTPVLTSVDPFSLPYLREKYNISDNTSHNGHGIVLVGFNETNRTICYNDPAAALFHDDVNGTYTYLPIDSFRYAVEDTTGTKFVVIIFTKSVHFYPPSPVERFKTAHNQNILRMKGRVTVYLPYLVPFLGRKAVHALKQDLRMGLTHRMLTVLLYVQYNGTILQTEYSIIAIEKHNVSSYLFEQENLSSICRHDAVLLQQESDYWKNLSLLVWKINEIRRNNSYLRTLLLSLPITLEMNTILSKIMKIEKTIIAGS